LKRRTGEFFGWRKPVQPCFDTVLPRIGNLLKTGMTTHIQPDPKRANDNQEIVVIVMNSGDEKQ
jgi:hypothetical protein